MKTIAIVTFPLGNISPEENIKVTESLKESLPDYNVIAFGSSLVNKISIEFFSPELQQSKDGDCWVSSGNVTIDAQTVKTVLDKYNSVAQKR